MTAMMIDFHVAVACLILRYSNKQTTHNTRAHAHTNSPNDPRSPHAEARRLHTRNVGAQPARQLFERVCPGGRGA
jgi:hypothetical protein